jgi:type III restriction enzyme
LDDTLAILTDEQSLSTTIEGLADEFCRQYQITFEAFKVGFKTLKADFESRCASLTTAESKWHASLDKHWEARDGVLGKLGAHKTLTAQIFKQKEEITDTTNRISDLKAKLKPEGGPSEALERALEELKIACSELERKTQEWATEIQQLSSGKIRATVVEVGNISSIRDAIDTIATKTGSQEATRSRSLIEAIAGISAESVARLLLNDCLLIIFCKKIGAASGESAPECATLFSLLGETAKKRATAFERMDTERVEVISTAAPWPEIALSYCDGEREIAFEKASEGQRAAALLFMLLEQDGGPLIIDQPEGDLDNRIISELTNKLHKSKQRRQLVFASHNANIVVNGSAELVGNLELSSVGERHFACAGAIDKFEVCEAITATMEGGEKAFKDRQTKYGY